MNPVAKEADWVKIQEDLSFRVEVSAKKEILVTKHISTNYILKVNNKPMNSRYKMYKGFPRLQIENQKQKTALCRQIFNYHLIHISEKEYK
jgi:hypothetical protein